MSLWTYRFKLFLCVSIHSGYFRTLGEASSWLSSLFDTTLVVLGNCLLTVWPDKLILYIFCPRLGFSHFLQKYWCLLVANGISELKCAVLAMPIAKNGLVIVPRSFQLLELEYMCRFICVYVFFKITCLSEFMLILPIPIQGFRVIT